MKISVVFRISPNFSSIYDIRVKLRVVVPLGSFWQHRHSRVLFVQSIRYGHTREATLEHIYRTDAGAMKKYCVRGTREAFETFLHSESLPVSSHSCEAITVQTSYDIGVWTIDKLTWEKDNRAPCRICTPTSDASGELTTFHHRNPAWKGLSCWVKLSRMLHAWWQRVDAVSQGMRSASTLAPLHGDYQNRSILTTIWMSFLGWNITSIFSTLAALHRPPHTCHVGQLVRWWRSGKWSIFSRMFLQGVFWPYFV